MTASERAEGCIFDRAWQSKCGAPAEGDPPLCDVHRGKRYRCWCGAQAVKECNIASSLVCGMPTCAEHECASVAGGLTGSHGFKHSKRGHEQYKQWREGQEANDDSD